MVKFGGVSGKNAERRIMGICLSRRNIEKLLDSQPIHFQAEEIGIPGVDVMVIAGEDERTILRELIDTAKEQGVPIKQVTRVPDPDPEAS